MNFNAKVDDAKCKVDRQRDEITVGLKITRLF